MHELNSTYVELLEREVGVTVHDLSEVSEVEFRAGDDDHKLYQVKAGALLYTSFRRVLFLDSDNTPVRDPTFLFSTDALRETGAVFWKDLWKTRPDNPIFSILGIECVDEFDQESGQILLDRSFPGVHRALKFSLWIQERSVLYYKLLLGDKDTFRLAWRVLGLPFHMVRPHVATLGNDFGDGYCGIAMVQFAPFWDVAKNGPAPFGVVDPTIPEIMFVHANLLKYMKMGKKKVSLEVM